MVTQMTIATISGYIKTHEKLLAVVLAVGLIWGVTGKVNDAIAAHDQRTLDADKATLQAQVEKNTAIAQANAQLAAQYQALAQQTAAANKQLEASNAALVTALSQRQATDATLAPSDLAARIESLTALPTNSVVSTSNGFSLTAPAAVSIAQHLESVPALTAQVTNLETEKANDEKQLSLQTDLVQGLNTQISGLKLTLGDATKVCSDQIAVVKADARKSKRRWFVAGFITGLAARGAIKIFGGI